jgi:hypothetical protein
MDKTTTTGAVILQAYSTRSSAVRALKACAGVQGPSRFNGSEWVRLVPNHRLEEHKGQWVLVRDAYGI